MKLKLLQHNENQIDSVYIYTDFLSKEEVFLVRDIVDKITKADQSLSYQTNVKANMTDWYTLLKIPELNPIIKKIEETILNTLLLRVPNPKFAYESKITQAWGMRHSKGDKTIHHIHGFQGFSGAFYCDVPDNDQYIYFSDQLNLHVLQTNDLIFFSSMCKHYVPGHIAEKDRLSFAFNVDIIEHK